MKRAFLFTAGFGVGVALAATAMTLADGLALGFGDPETSAVSSCAFLHPPTRAGSNANNKKKRRGIYKSSFKLTCDASFWKPDSRGNRAWVVRGYGDQTHVAIQRMGLMGHIGPMGERHLGLVSCVPSVGSAQRAPLRPHALTPFRLRPIAVVER